jgi:hypothetical protein
VGQTKYPANNKAQSVAGQFYRQAQQVVQAHQQAARKLLGGKKPPASKGN